MLDIDSLGVSLISVGGFVRGTIFRVTWLGFHYFGWLLLGDGPLSVLIWSALFRSYFAPVLLYPQHQKMSYGR